MRFWLFVLTVVVVGAAYNLHPVVGVYLLLTVLALLVFRGLLSYNNREEHRGRW